jgi:hypothetical protein
MSKTLDQLQAGQSYNLSQVLAEELIRRGVAVGPDGIQPTGPTEIQPTAPTESKPAGPTELKAPPELKIKKNSRRARTEKES